MSEPSDLEILNRLIRIADDVIAVESRSEGPLSDALGFALDLLDIGAPQTSTSGDHPPLHLRHLVHIGNPDLLRSVPIVG
jgi:hypothetical protein